MSFLLDTDIVLILERKAAPAGLIEWIRENEGEIFLSVVTFAELQFGLEHAPETHKPQLGLWLAQTRQKFAPATEELSEAVLVRWKKLLSELKSKNRTMTCEDSLVAATALYHGHTVATHNRRHFEPAGVSIVDPLS
jgi:toxin FitB